MMVQNDSYCFCCTISFFASDIMTLSVSVHNSSCMNIEYMSISIFKTEKIEGRRYSFLTNPRIFNMIHCLSSLLFCFVLFLFCLFICVCLFVCVCVLLLFLPTYITYGYCPRIKAYCFELLISGCVDYIVFTPSF